MSRAIKKFIIIISALLSFFILLSSIYFFCFSNPAQPEHINKRFWLYCVVFSSLILSSMIFKLGQFEKVIINGVTILNKKIARIIGVLGFAILSFGPLAIAIHDKYAIKNNGWNLDFIAIGICGIIICIYLFVVSDRSGE